jgi:hypothetical protein
MPEGNFCVRKEVLEKCFPDFKNFPEDHDPWFEFMFNFNSQGYLAYNIPVIAHFGRLHKGQRSQRENEKGLTPKRANAYIKRIKRYRRKILLGSITHIYRDGKHNILPVKFPRKEFCKDYVYFNAWRVIGRINKLYQGKI